MAKPAKRNILPFEDAGSERAVLAVAVNIPNAIVEIESLVSEKDFLTRHNRYIYTALCNLYLNHGVTNFDLTSLVNELKSCDALETSGGFDYVNSLFDTPILKENLDSYISKVLENSAKKYLYDKLSVLKDEVEKNASGAEAKQSSDLFHMVEEGVTDALMQSTRSTEADNIGSGIIEFVDTLIESPPGIAGDSTGFKILDERINGLLPGSLTVLVARPKVGKSTILCEWAKHLSMFSKNSKPILYVDTEMSTDEVKKRMLSNLSGVRERWISNGSFQSNPDQVDRVIRAAQVMQNAKFFHKHVPGIKVEQVASLAKKYKIRENIGALFFDYVKLTDMTLLKSAAEHQLLGHISQVLKDLASTLQIPVITAAQIGRSGAKSKSGLISSDMIADSDRLLRYCNTLLAFSKKTGEEISSIEGERGKEGMKDYFRLEGSHRLQVLETRGGGSLVEGMNVVFMKDILHVKEADKQPMHVYDNSFGDEDSVF